MMERTRRTDRDYVGGIVAAILFFLLFGFSRSFFLLPLFKASPSWAAMEPIFYIHGFVFSGWFALLGIQTYLIRAHSPELHRKLGYLGAGLGAGIVLLGTYSALRAANRPGGFIDVPLPPQQFLIVPLIGMAQFAAFLLLAVAKRARPAAHKRFVLLASISLLPAAIARLPLMFPILPGWIDAVVCTVLVAAMGVWDIETQGRLLPETILGGPLLVGSNLLALPIATSAAWQAFALWMMSFAGPP